MIMLGFISPTVNPPINKQRLPTAKILQIEFRNLPVCIAEIIGLQFAKRYRTAKRILKHTGLLIHLFGF